MSLRFWSMKYGDSFVLNPTNSKWEQVNGVTLKEGASDNPCPEKSMKSILVHLGHGEDASQIPLNKIVVVPPPEG